MSGLFYALRDLNRAAYAAIRAGVDTTEYPDLDRATLRDIARQTDKLVDDNAPTIAPRAADRGAPLTGGQASARAESPAGPFSFPDAAPTHGNAAVTGGGSSTPPRAAAGDIEDDGMITVYPAPAYAPRNHAEEIALAMLAQDQQDQRRAELRAKFDEESG